MVKNRNSKSSLKRISASRYSPSDQAEREAIHTLEAILGFEYIKPHVYGNDRTPDQDGYIDVLDESKNVAGQIFVQVKKIPDGHCKYSLKAKYIQYGLNVCSAPFFIFCLDVRNKILFWRQIDGTIVLKEGRGSTTIHFKREDTIKKKK